MQVVQVSRLRLWYKLTTANANVVNHALKQGDSGHAPESLCISNQSGFTLIELIITIVLIGILSVVATTRFQSASSFDTFSLQGQILTALRHIQFRAMQDTRQDYCHKLIFDTAGPAIGIPSNNYAATSEAATQTCANSIGNNIPDYLSIEASEFSSLGASLSATDGTTNVDWLDFDSFGRPLTTASNCANDCQIMVSAQSSASVCVNAEGFIRAC